MLSLNSLVDMFPHTTQLLDILGVHSFHVEVVSLLVQAETSAK